jgi:hypothetical protein
MYDGPSGGIQRPGSDGDAAPDRWQQQAGFSVFFDVQSRPPGEPGGRTRLYHEETGDEATFPGCEPADWVRWMLNRLRSVQPASGTTPSVVTMEIIDARLVGDAMPGDGDDSVGVELQLRVTGMTELHRALGARVVGILFGSELQ